MPEPDLLAQQRTALKDLHVLLVERARREPAIEEEFRESTARIEQEFRAAIEKVSARFETDKTAALEEFEEVQVRARKRFDAERHAQDKELRSTTQAVEQQYETESTATKEEHYKIIAVLDQTLKTRKAAANHELEAALEKTTEAMRQCKRIQREADDRLNAWKQQRDYGPLPPPSKKERPTYDAYRHLNEVLEEAEKRLKDLAALKLPQLFEGQRIIGVIGAFVVVGTIVAGIIGQLEEHLYHGLAAGAVCGLLVGGMTALWLYNKAKDQVAVVYDKLRQGLVDADLAIGKAREQANEQHARKMASDGKAYDQEASNATDRHIRKMTTIKDRRNYQLRQAQEKHQKELADSTQKRDTRLREAHDKYQRLRTQIYGQYEVDSQAIHERHFQQNNAARQRYETQWQELTTLWRDGLGRFNGMVERVRGESDRLLPEWSRLSDKRDVQTDVPPVLRFGDYQVDFATLPGGLSKDERLKPTVPTRVTIPALTTFPERCSLMLKTTAANRAQALPVLQAQMYRYLTSLPPGKVRFTIIDPVGLGESFASFMHLTDYDEALVTNRIWTEPGHIEQRLLDLTEHLENVLQKYLRDEYATIEDYNAEAGEVAEPFRVLVIASFPANFSAEAARRLVSIVTSGVRCGVFTLMSVDTSLELPHGFSLASIEPYLVILDGQAGPFVWKDADFERYPLQPEAPPQTDLGRKLIQTIGARARDANKVEVPFEFIMPPTEQWWTTDARGGVDVPLGKAGATKRQHLQLGKGTSQHVLLAGKTGSGKSTLLHALITNASLVYSPEELELYLIDFKKGVEFRTYAAEELPHARVVAIESDREFGLSVLQRLDAELKRRGELFRAVGAQDLRGYRDAVPGSRLPRILLVVDEFQEFFTEDDKVAQDATGLLDRLVRQGRAFGLHVLLGSQTLGGAYTLARSTIDQMGVRIALQCSEADGHLILSDDNSAARLLSRPGEAIYNDANGLIEGNHPFQVVWLQEGRRESLLKQIRELDRVKYPIAARQQLVFEGNIPADLRKNLLLQRLASEPTWPTTRTASAWLGEAMAIKDPTAAVFRRNSGCNLLLIGQQEEAARGLLATAILSLAVQHGPTDARFLLLDGTPNDQPNADYLPSLAGIVPHTVQVVKPRDLPTVFAELAEEVDRRSKGTDGDGATTYVLIQGLQRFRDLRKAEDDFGFGGSGSEPPSPAKLLATILKEGAAVGIHVLAWCDTATNMQRAFDRAAQREFDQRVLFQMSAADSSNLIDSPAASRLGDNRALWHSEEEGRLEKFRPYGLPSEAWLKWFRLQLSRKQVAAGQPR